jgi:hypothetical protein
MYAAMKLVVERSWTWRGFLFLGAMGGLTLCTRPGGLPMMVVLLAASLLASRMTRPKDAAPGAARTSWKSLVWRGVAAFAMAWTIMVLPWPFAHGNPILNPIEAMRFAMSFPDSYPVLFEGAVWQSDVLPWRYLPQYLLICTPLTMLALTIAGIVLATKLVLRDRHDRRTTPASIAVLWFVLPVVAFVALRPNVYDGMRHFLFVLPAMALLAAFGGARTIEWAKTRRQAWTRWATTAAVGACVAMPIVPLVRLHPYQMTYFNLLVGGLRGADGDYDTDYWASSYREAMLWINALASQQPGRTIVVLVGGGPFLEPTVEHFAAPNVSIHMIADDPGLRTLPPSVDYFMSTTRYDLGWRLFPDAPIVHRVGREGVVFTLIKGRAD